MRALKVPELKQLCDPHDVRKTGKKEELVARLCDALSNAEQPTEKTNFSKAKVLKMLDLPEMQSLLRQKRLRQPCGARSPGALRTPPPRASRRGSARAPCARGAWALRGRHHACVRYVCPQKHVEFGPTCPGTARALAARLGEGSTLSMIAVHLIVISRHLLFAGGAPYLALTAVTAMPRTTIERTPVVPATRRASDGCTVDGVFVCVFV